MRIRARRPAGLLFAALALAACDSAREESAELLIRDVTIISPELGEPVVNGWVTVANGNVVATGTGTPPAAATVIDGEGRFLTPGLAETVGAAPPPDETRPARTSVGTG